MILVGFIFLRYDVRVPVLEELTVISGKVEDYSCKGLSRYGDSLSIKLFSYDNWMFVQGIKFNCNEIKAQLEKSNFQITLWVDNLGVDAIIRAFKLSKSDYVSSQLGYSGKRLNIFSLLLVCVGFALLFLPISRESE